MSTFYPSFCYTLNPLRYKSKVWQYLWPLQGRKRYFVRSGLEDLQIGRDWEHVLCSPRKFHSLNALETKVGSNQVVLEVRSSTVSLSHSLVSFSCWFNMLSHYRIKLGG